MHFQIRDLGILGAELISETGNHHSDKGTLALERGREPLVVRNLGVSDVLRLHEIRPAHLLEGRLVLEKLTEVSFMADIRVLETESILVSALPLKIIIPLRSP